MVEKSVKLCSSLVDVVYILSEVQVNFRIRKEFLRIRRFTNVIQKYSIMGNIGFEKQIIKIYNYRDFLLQQS